MYEIEAGTKTTRIKRRRRFGRYAWSTWIELMVGGKKSGGGRSAGSGKGLLCGAAGGEGNGRIFIAFFRKSRRMGYESNINIHE